MSSGIQSEERCFKNKVRDQSMRMTPLGLSVANMSISSGYKSKAGRL